MLKSYNEINEELRKLKEQRARINSLIDYYEHMKQQAIAKEYRGRYQLDNDVSDMLDRQTVRYFMKQ